jgi:hypothetical protein
MKTINLNGISFRWNGDQLLIPSPHGQDLLSGKDAGLLLDFLQAHQQEIYRAEQGRQLPNWAQSGPRFVLREVAEEEPRQLEEGKK